MTASTVVVPRWAVWRAGANASDSGAPRNGDGGAQVNQYPPLLRDLARSEGRLPVGGGGVPPWVMVAPVPDAPSGARLALLTLSPAAQETTGAGGPCPGQARYFECEYLPLATAEVGYTTLFDALDPVTLPAAEVSVVARGLDLPELAAFTDMIGFDWLATVAAHLLAGAVVLTGEAAPILVRERLRYLDAIVTLLPYSVRAELAVSTLDMAMGEPGVARWRLSFGDGVPAGASTDTDRRLVVRCGEPVSEPPAGLAGEYLAQLRGLHRRLGTERLIAQLWRDRRGLTLVDPAAVTGMVRQLNLAYEVRDQIGRGEAGPAHAAQLLVELDLSGADARLRQDLAACLLDAQEPDALGVLARHWSGPVQDAVLAWLARAAPAQARSVLALVREAGAVESFLTGVIAWVDRGMMDRDAAARLFAALVPRRPMPGLGTRLLRDPDLVSRVLLRCAEVGGDRVAAWAGVLADRAGQPQPPGWLATLTAVVEGGAAPTAAQVVAFDRVAQLAMPALLAVAVSMDAPERILAPQPAWGLLFVGATANDERFRTELDIIAKSVGHPGGAQQAALDLLVLACGHPLRRLPTLAPAEYMDDYVSGLARQFDRFVTPPWQARCLIALVEAIVASPEPLTTGSVKFLFRLVEMAPSNAVRAVVLTPAAVRLAKNRAVPADLSRAERTELSALWDQARRRGRLFAIATNASQDATPEQLGYLCAQAIDDDIPIETAVDAMRRWPGLADPTRAHIMLTVLAGWFGADSEEVLARASLCVFAERNDARQRYRSWLREHNKAAIRRLATNRRLLRTLRVARWWRRRTNRRDG